MSIENHKSKLVSDKELLSDIEITGRELEAYQKIKDGFTTLAQLPENIESGKSSVYRFEAMKYGALESECAVFLLNLHALKAERGLK